MARSTKKLTVRDEFLILTNGKESEKNYFEAIKSKKSIYKVKVKFVNADPEGLVRSAIPEKTKSNRVWCVFDRDEFPKDRIETALRLADQNGIGVGFSNAAFEVWLIYHFQNIDGEKTAAQLLDELDKILKTNCYAKGYEKSDLTVMKKVFAKRLGEAVYRAECAHQKRIAILRELDEKVDRYSVCEWNPYTNLHKLIEALRLTDKD